LFDTHTIFEKLIILSVAHIYIEIIIIRMSQAVANNTITSIISGKRGRSRSPGAASKKGNGIDDWE
jgi:hypothetical protein